MRSWGSSRRCERRQLNQALFVHLLVDEDEIAEASLAEPFETLADPKTPWRIKKELR